MWVAFFGWWPSVLGKLGAGSELVQTLLTASGWAGLWFAVAAWTS